MATTNPKVSLLTIALIVFALLTFILTITSYLFFKQRTDEQAKSQVAEKALADKQEELLASRAENEELRKFIGSTNDEPLGDIETNLNNLFATDFAGFRGDTRSYGQLVAWLRNEFRRKDGEVKTSDDKSKQASKDADDARSQATAAKDESEKRVQQIRDEQEKSKQAFDEQWKNHEQKQTDLLQAKSAAETRADRLGLLVAEIANGGQYLAANRQKDFKAKETAEDRLDLIYAELRDRAKVIDEQNRILASLRVADRGLQEQVLAATPKDDRIDGFDGRVLSVDERERSVLMSCASSRGIRPGMILHVFTADDNDRPQAGDRKGVVEVTSIEGPSLLRGTIRRDSTRSPILVGDGVATSLWAAGTAPEVVIVGYVNLDDERGDDRDRLVDLVQRAGGRVVEAVTPMTAMVVDAGKPPAELGEEGFAEEARRQNRSLGTAKQYGVRVVGLDSLLDMLGLSRAALTADRLPRAAAAR
jgi:hypothetical protein